MPLAEPRLRSPRRFFEIGLVAAAVVWGVSAACRDAWTCDDAYIVFRYAKNLVDGFGLVFNAGERVEGFTDLLWVLWTTPAFLLGIAPETWTNAWGIVFYGGTIALLGFEHFRLVRLVASPAWAVLPVAALAAAAHGDWNAWATSGLETSAFTFFLVAGYVVLVGPLSTVRLAAVGLLFGLATLLRPDESCRYSSEASLSLRRHALCGRPPSTLWAFLRCGFQPPRFDSGTTVPWSRTPSGRSPRTWPGGRRDFATSASTSRSTACSHSDWRCSLWWPCAGNT